MASTAVFEGCYEESRTETHEWLQSLEKQIQDAAKRKEDEDVITIEKAAFNELIDMASLTLYEGCYGKNRTEQWKWVQSLKKRLQDAKAGKPPSPKKRTQFPPLTEEQLTGMDIRTIRRDLDYTIPGLFIEIKKIKSDGNQHNRFSSFDYTGKQLDDYAGPQLKLMIENDDGKYFSCFKHLKAHVMPMVWSVDLICKWRRCEITYTSTIHRYLVRTES